MKKSQQSNPEIYPVKDMSIDGMYGRAEYYLFNNQKENPYSHNFQDIDMNGVKQEGGDFIDGLPEGVTKDDYFRIALLTEIREFNDNVKKIPVAMNETNKEVNKNLEWIHDSISSLDHTVRRKEPKKRNLLQILKDLFSR